MIKGVRIFDTILDSGNRKDTVTRNSADFWKPFCAASGWRFSYERVHSLSDLQFFLNKKISEDVIIFSGHGDNNDGFHLSNGDVLNGDENQLICPTKNHGKIIIFSSCLMGKNDDLMNDICALFSPMAVFAYTDVIHDKYCFLYESILLSMMEHKYGNGTTRISAPFFERFTEETMFMKNMNKKFANNHPMRMFS